MRAAVLREGGRLEVVDELEVREPLAGEVLVDVAYSGLCHSDLSVISRAPDEVPIILGHEVAGVVTAVGSDVHEVAPEDKVVLSPMSSCGRCYWCVRGRPSCCELNHTPTLHQPLPSGVPGFRLGGDEVLRGLGVAGFSERTLTTPAGLTRIPDDTPLDVASILGCAVRTGVGAVLNTAEVEPGSSVLVMGLGGVGLSVVLGAVLANAWPIVVMDPVASRRELALDLGATSAAAPDDDIVAHVRAATGGRGVDYAFDAAGSAALVKLGFDATTHGGAVVVVGINSADTFELPALPFVFQEKRLVGSLIGSSLVHRDVPRLLAFRDAGRLPLERLITHRRPIEEIEQGFDDMRAGVGVRTLIEF